MGCRNEIARGIVDRGADYLLAVKENQGQLYQNVRDLFEAVDGTGLDGLPHDYATTPDKGRRRTARRECRAADDPDCREYPDTAGDWPGLRPVVAAKHRGETDEGTTTQARYYISSLAALAGPPQAAAQEHWSIANSLHCTMDATTREDQSRARKEHGPQNMATLRQISHNLPKRETSLKAGIGGKRLQAGGLEDYLRKVLLS